MVSPISPAGTAAVSLKSVAYCGFSDTANVGDYALYRANRLLFPEFDLRESADRGAGVNLFGGGTLYPYCLRGRFYPKRRVNHAIGIGVMDPEFDGRFGPLTVLAMKTWRFGVFGVRGPRSRRILQKYRIEAEVTGDTALIHSPSRAMPRAEDSVGICLVGERMQRIGDRDRVGREVEGFARLLLRDGRPVTFIPFGIHDVPFAETLRDQLGPGAGVLNFWTDFGEELQPFLDTLSTFGLIVGERLHASILAAALDVPFLALGYKPKCYDFMESIGLVDSIIDCRTLTAASLYERAVRALGDQEEMRSEVSRRVEEYRCKLREAAGRIAAAVLA